MPKYIAEALQASESLDAIFTHGEDMRDSVNANTNKQCNALGSRLENLENLMMGKPVKQESLGKQEQLAQNVLIVRSIQNQNAALRADIKAGRVQASSQDSPANAAGAKAKAKPKAKAKAQALQPEPQPVPLELVLVPLGRLVQGPLWPQFAQHHEVLAGLQTKSLPADLLEAVANYINSVLPAVELHVFARNHKALEERPKRVWARPHPEHGGFPLYIWGQEMADYGMVEKPSDIIDQLITFMSAACQEEFNHCMLTLHAHGNHGIPPHSDKTFSKESRGKFETSSKIADVSLGASRAFVIVGQDVKTNRNLADFQDLIVASIEVTHGSYMCMTGGLNAALQHCVPWMPEVDKPRVSLVFRRADKRYVHPTENKIRSFTDKDWKDVKNNVQIRRQKPIEN